MKLLTRALGALGLERRNSVAGHDPYWSDFAGMRSSPVNAKTAQSVSAVYACVQAIAETTASLPLILFKRAGEDRLRASEHPLYAVLHDMANPEQTALEAREYLQACVLLRGNAFARIVRGMDGQVRELWPMSPDRVTVLRAAGKLAYDYTDRNSVLHRLLAHVDTLAAARVVIAVAGMEGALASVVGGLVSCPVVAVPTSVGYGASFGGMAALLSMLNSCASGVSVVNIDNGFGAGYLASRINQMEGVE